jgi:hypothetical protein
MKRRRPLEPTALNGLLYILFVIGISLVVGGIMSLAVVMSAPAGKAHAEVIDPYDTPTCLDTEQYIDGQCIPNEYVEPAPTSEPEPPTSPTDEPYPEPTVEPEPEPTITPTPTPQPSTEAPAPETGPTAPVTPEKVVMDDVQPVGTLAPTGVQETVISALAGAVAGLIFVGLMSLIVPKLWRRLEAKRAAKRKADGPTTRRASDDDINETYFEKRLRTLAREKEFRKVKVIDLGETEVPTYDLTGDLKRRIYDAYSSRLMAHKRDVPSLWALDMVIWEAIDHGWTDSEISRAMKMHPHYGNKFIRWSKLRRKEGRWQDIEQSPEPTPPSGGATPPE